MSWSDRIMEFNDNLSTELKLPKGIDWIYPQENPETVRCMRRFYDKYYSDNAERVLLLGINPGRFGAGVTGIPFTDPAILESDLGIDNSFDKRAELSSSFVYEIVHAMGGPAHFFGKYYIASVCPLGFIKDGKNFNYYDSADLAEAVMPMILANIKTQIEMGARSDVVFSIGKGKNYKFLKDLNKQHGLFDKVIALPHPRWVMQYRLKFKNEFIDEYVSILEDQL